MGITKQMAFKALAAKARKRVGLGFDSRNLLPDALVAEFLKSNESSYRNFAESYENIEYKHGGHPDYNYLAEAENVGKTENGAISTLFLDLKNFTKYCKLLTPAAVYQAKAATIEAAIGVCRIYAGHLHEIPGDGVMVFFGGKNQNSLSTARNALDAAVDVIKLLEEDVIPEYNNDGKYPNIYPKIGVDFGDSLWGAYGSSPYYEVKATAFNVDIAAKMMVQCNARDVAVGDDLKAHLELDEEKYLTKGWLYERQLTVDGEKRCFSYQTWKFDWRKYFADRSDENSDLARVGRSFVNTANYAPAIVKSRTTLGDAPLA